MARIARAAFLLALPLCGCAVTAGEFAIGDRAVNRCQTNDDCGDGVCVDQVCAAPSGALSSVLLSVTPSLAGATYYVDYPTEGTSDTSPDDVNLPPMVSFTDGSISIDTTPCEPQFIPADGTSIQIKAPPGQPDNHDGTLPADVTFVPSGRAAGLPPDVYRGVVQPGGYLFGANLPPGDYDIYIKPYKQPIDDKTGDTICPVPPRLLLKQSVTGSRSYKLKAASQLYVDVVWAKDASAAGWTVDLIDPSTGYPISTSRVLRDDDPITVGTDDATHHIKLDYVPTYGPNDDGELQSLSIGTDVLRLRPPEVPGYPPPVAPTLLVQLTGADLGNDPSSTKPAVVRQSTPIPDKVKVEITTEIAARRTPVAASVTLTATSLPGFPDVFTSFTRSVATDATGFATVDLLPGKYQVVATAQATCDDTSCLGTTETTWTISPATGEQGEQGGRLLEFKDAAQIRGRAVVPSGEPAVGALVRALASVSVVDSNVMNLGDGTAPSLPRATFGQVNAQGDFGLNVDGGTYDFRVEPDPSTGFGWYVRPIVPISAGIASDLDVVRLPLPVLHRGVVSTGTGDSRVGLPSAFIRAYAYMRADGSITPTPTQDAIAVQVAETHSDAAGNFTLLLPSSLGER